MLAVLRGKMCNGSGMPLDLPQNLPLVLKLGWDVNFGFAIRTRILLMHKTESVQFPPAPD